MQAVDFCDPDAMCDNCRCGPQDTVMTTLLDGTRLCRVCTHVHDAKQQEPGLKPYPVSTASGPAMVFPYNAPVEGAPQRSLPPAASAAPQRPAVPPQQPYTVNGITFRPCEACKKPFEWDGVDWKKVCYGCYRDKTRACVKCKVNKVPATAPAWHQVCVSCFLEDKQQKGFSQCPTCPPEKATHLRRAPGQAQCAECAAKRRKIE